MKELIKTDNLEEAFNQVHVYTAVNTEKVYNNDMILLTQRYNRIRKNERLGSVLHQEINQELNKISKSLLELLENFE